MAKNKRVKKAIDYSLSQLQPLVASTQSELADLKAKRAEVQRPLNEPDQILSKKVPLAHGAAIGYTHRLKTRVVFDEWDRPKRGKAAVILG